MQDRLIACWIWKVRRRTRLPPNTTHVVHVGVVCGHRSRKCASLRRRAQKRAAPQRRSFYRREFSVSCCPRALAKSGSRSCGGAIAPRANWAAILRFLPMERRLAVSLGDVSGKGTAARCSGSLQSAPCANTSRSIRVLRGNASVLNRRLYGAHLDSRFIRYGLRGVRRWRTAAYAGKCRRPYPILVSRWRSAAIRVGGIPSPFFQIRNTMSHYQASSRGHRFVRVYGILESETRKKQDRLPAPDCCHQRISPLQSASEICDVILNATDRIQRRGFTPHDDRTLL